MAPYIVMPLVGGASCGASDWIKPRLSMRLVREKQRREFEGIHSQILHSTWLYTLKTDLIQ